MDNNIVIIAHDRKKEVLREFIQVQLEHQAFESGKVWWV
jgi:methylglyoxal synthase